MEHLFILFYKGIPLNEMDELEVSNLWGELLHIINYDNSLVEYFVQAIRMETDLLKLRLYITTSNRIVKDPACQMMLMESAIHKAMTLGTVLLLSLSSKSSFRTWSSAVTRNAVHTSFSRARRAANDTLYDVSAALDDQKSICEILVKAF